MQETSFLKKFGFRLAELTLKVRLREIEKEVSRAAGCPVRLERFIRGRGWGVKYLGFPTGGDSPAWVVKAASGLIEFRLKQALKGAYIPAGERFSRECRLLEELEKLALGPRVLLCTQGFFAREFVAGTPLTELSPGDLPAHVEPVLQAIERTVVEKVFHTDPNATNVIVRADGGGYCLIDSEIPGEDDPEGELASIRRVYCHERFLYSLSPVKIKLPSHVSSKALSVAVNFFDRMGDDAPVPPARVAALVSGNATPVEFPG
ncbi:MAG TPA: hypothetical protein VJ417_07015 [Candidatus Glassbacteria bacterium]|nr:hypothetical protein [Candidatus Glassbacteria bacterium]